MNVIVKIPVEIPEDTIAELAKKAADQLVNDERDLVNVVRCNDCRNWDYSLAICRFHGDTNFDEDDFCSRGDRRENQ